MTLALWEGSLKKKVGGEGTAWGGAELEQLLLQPSGTGVKLAAVLGVHSLKGRRKGTREK